jgi:soluble lytic murein transglycosylase
VISRVVALALAAAAGAVSARASSSVPWLQATPADAGETAIRDALTQEAFGGPRAQAEELRRRAAASPGTAASGLAQLAAGLLLVDAGRHAEAVSALTHPDVALTALADHALHGLGQAKEAARDSAGAGVTFLAAADARPQGPLVCPALLRAAEAFAEARQLDRALTCLNRALAACPDDEPRLLLRLARVQDARGDRRAAAAAFDRLDADHPASPEAREGQRRWAALLGLLPPMEPQVGVARALKKAMALVEIGRHRDAVPLLRTLLSRKLAPEELELVRVRLGRALLSLGQPRDAQAAFAGVRSGSPADAEVAYEWARYQARRQRSAAPYEAFLARFPATPWAEEALLALANHFQKDARDQEAVPYYRRLLETAPEGRYAPRAAWRVAWADYREGRFEAAATLLERVARLGTNAASAGFLYWAGRARRELGQVDTARQLLAETVRRFKHTYHGIRARELLAQLPPAAATASTVSPGAAAPAEVPEPQAARVRQLLLIDRLEEAAEELRTLPPSTTSRATLAWIEWRRGRLRPAIVAMKRAFPEYVSEAGDLLAPEVWRILYPLAFGDLLRTTASEAGLDPALVAALVCQESTFDAGAISRAGARGLMQVIPPTGRQIARDLGLTFRRQALHDPKLSLAFGTHYLKQMIDRFGGRVERALAAYNAGPHRVEAWTAGRPEMSAEEFIESIPFSETRNYVMVVLASQDHYRRLYGLTVAPASTPAGDSLP